MGIHTDGPAGARRSWPVFLLAGLAFASALPRNDRNWPASVLVPAIARVVSNRPRLQASSSALPGSAPSLHFLLPAEAALVLRHALPLVPDLYVCGVHLGLHFDTDR